MKAMILAAGVGSRLDPLTREIPKPMVPIVNRPVMEYLIDLLKTNGFTEIMVNTCYLGDTIVDYFGDGSRFGIPIHYSHEDRLWGDAGSVKNVESFFKDDTFLVIGGDDLTDMDLAAVVNTHKAKGATATLALSLVDDPSEYGIALMDEAGRITRFLEKPKGVPVFSNTANTGVYVFEPSVFDLIPANKFFLFGKQLLPLLLEKGFPMYGHVTDAYWKDVGSLKIYKGAQGEVLTGQVKADLPFVEVRPQIWQGADAKVDPSANLIAPVVIGAGATVGANATVGQNSVVGNGGTIEANATVLDTILWEGATVGAGTHLERCIVGRNGNVSANGGIFDGILVAPFKPPYPANAE